MESNGKKAVEDGLEEETKGHEFQNLTPDRLKPGGGRAQMVDWRPEAGETYLT